MEVIMDKEELKNKLQNRINVTIECIRTSAYDISERHNNLIGQLDTLSYMLFLKEKFDND
jgi:hypothetical protein